MELIVKKWTLAEEGTSYPPRRRSKKSCPQADQLSVSPALTVKPIGCRGLSGSGAQKVPVASTVPFCLKNAHSAYYTFMPSDAERWRFLADHKLTLHTDGGD